MEVWGGAQVERGDLEVTVGGWQANVRQVLGVRQKPSRRGLWG